MTRAHDRDPSGAPGLSDPSEDTAAALRSTQEALRRANARMDNMLDSLSDGFCVVDQDWRIGLLWEGRIKELLFTLGASLDLKKREQIFRSVGIELQYSS